MSAILHCDLNNFYASVECVLNPELASNPIAVCGSAQNRHGIVLAKNQLAKSVGVSTGETIWQARQKCPDLIVVPPHYEAYYMYSNLVSDIYKKYTDMVEPFGIDECWLDITGSLRLFGSPYEIAEQIRREVYENYGVTISVGVSFNKIFAKMGSDLKKPNAVSVINEDNFREMLWGLSASEMMGVGRSTAKKLKSVGIYTIGDIARSSHEYLKKLLGKHGFTLWQWANGYDYSTVCHQDFVSEAKSVGNSTTCVKDISTFDEAARVVLALSEKIAHRLRSDSLMTSGIVLHIKTPNFCVSEYTLRLPTQSCDTMTIFSAALKLLKENWFWESDIRAIGVRAIALCSDGKQLNLFCDHKRELKREDLENSMDNIRDKFGKTSIKRASLMLPSLMPRFNTTEDIHMPNFTGK